MKEIFKCVTVNDFKNYFFRDFPYLPVYDNSKVYNKEDIAYFNGSFYKSLADNNMSLPTDSTKWSATTEYKELDYITDGDIEKAMSQAIISAKEFGSDDCERKIIYLHLVAYYLVVDLKNSSQGIGSTFAGVVQSKSVGDVSESYAIPTWLSNNPMYSMYGSNGYGLKYLSLIAPYLAITLLFSRGRTTIG